MRSVTNLGDAETLAPPGFSLDRLALDELDKTVETLGTLKTRGKVLHFELMLAVETSVFPHLPAPPCVIVSVAGLAALL